MSRIINVTPFTPALQGTGHQLVAIQTLNEKDVDQAAVYFNELKKKGWIDPRG